MKAIGPAKTESWLDSFRHEMDDVFQRFLMPFEKSTAVAMQAWTPQVDVEETDKQLLVKADIPGVKPEDVEISIINGSLVLQGEKKEKREESKKNFHPIERFVGKFYRAIPLPAGADEEAITAECSKGVVTITVPKKPEVQPKKVPIKSND